MVNYPAGNGTDVAAMFDLRASVLAATPTTIAQVQVGCLDCMPGEMISTWDCVPITGCCSCSSSSTCA